MMCNHCSSMCIHFFADRMCKLYSTCNVDSDHKADAQTYLGLCWSHKVLFFLKDSIIIVYFTWRHLKVLQKINKSFYFLFLLVLKKIVQTYINTSLITAYVIYCVFP